MRCISPYPRYSMYRWGKDDRSDETGVSLYPEADDWAEIPVYPGVGDGAEIPVYPGVGDGAKVPVNPDGLWDTAVVLVYSDVEMTLQATPVVLQRIAKKDTCRPPSR